MLIGFSFVCFFHSLIHSNDLFFFEDLVEAVIPLVDSLDFVDVFHPEAHRLELGNLALCHQGYHRVDLVEKGDVHHRIALRSAQERAATLTQHPVQLGQDRPVEVVQRKFHVFRTVLLRRRLLLSSRGPGRRAASA